MFRCTLLNHERFLGYNPDFSMNTWTRFLNVAPVVLTAALLWAKQLYFNLVLQGVRGRSGGNLSSLDMMLMSSSLASILLPIGLILLLHPVLRYAALLLLNVVVTTLILTDEVSVRFYGHVFSFFHVTPIRMIQTVLPSIHALLQSKDALYYADIVAACLLMPLYIAMLRRAQSIKPERSGREAVITLAVGCALAAPSVHLLHETKVISTYENVYRQVPTVIGILPYHFYDLLMHVRPRAKIIPATDLRRTMSIIRDTRARGKLTSPLYGAARNRNLILISAESLNLFPIGMRVNGQPVTPRLSAFAAQSLYFSNVYDQTNLGTTSDGEFIALNSLHAVAAGYAVYRHSKNTFYSLPAILRKHGYRAISACAEPGDIWDMAKAHPRYGFERSFFESSYSQGERIGHWITDEQFFRETVALLKSQSWPFMAFLISSSNHHPFDLPERHQTLEVGVLNGTLVGKYLQSVHYFDYAFGILLDSLQKAGLLETSVVALYGDHEGYVAKEKKLAELLHFEENSELDRFRAQKRIPFIVKLPGAEKADTFPVTGGHLDITPTLLGLLGIYEENAVLLGRDLTTEQEEFATFRDGSFIDHQHLFLNRFGPLSASSCYEVRSGNRIDCARLIARREEALAQLRTSDLILQGDLISSLMSNRP
jgi:lipoteichoic acid synthase